MARFEKGRSGNPAGKPVGTRNRATEVAEKLLAGEIEDVARAVVESAKAGDMTAAKIILDRIAPARKDRSVKINFPTMVGAAGLVSAFDALLKAVAAGEITPSEGHGLANLLEARRKAMETDEFSKRIAALEQAVREQI